MNRTTRKIGIILIFIILVPVLFYSAYELSNLNANEEVIKRIYSSQLEAILFSINQYSEDIVTNWVNRFNNLQSAGNDSSVIKFFKENPAVTFLFMSDTALNKITPLYSSGSDDFMSSLSDLRDNIRLRTKRLIQFKSEGYLRLEPVESSKDHSLIIFAPGEASEPLIAGIIFRHEDFIRRTLSPRIEAIAAEEFIIRVIRNEDNTLIYSNESETSETEPEQTRALWLLPGYSLSILIQGDTIESLAKERLYTNIILIVLLNVILFFGIWLIFRNIKNEIRLAQIKSDFVANVSHELRTPLALVSMFAETLEMGRVRTEEKKQEYYSIISQETGRLSKIVNKILNFSKMEAGKRNYSFGEADLNTIVVNVFGTYKFHLQNNGFKSDIDLYHDELIVKAHAEAVSETLINLIDNAIKYSQDKKYIKISTGRNNGSAYIEVMDKGIGISAENKARIFEKFYRVQSGLVHNSKGTGLGLSIVKHIMEAHNGEVTVNSTLWEGSTFRLTFPVTAIKQPEGIE